MAAALRVRAGPGLVALLAVDADDAELVKDRRDLLAHLLAHLLRDPVRCGATAEPAGGDRVLVRPERAVGVCAAQKSPPISGGALHGSPRRFSEAHARVRAAVVITERLSPVYARLPQARAAG